MMMKMACVSIDISNLEVILYLSLQDVIIGKTWQEGISVESLCIIFYNFLWIYSDLKISLAFKKPLESIALLFLRCIKDRHRVILEMNT